MENKTRKIVFFSPFFKVGLLQIETWDSQDFEKANFKKFKKKSKILGKNLKSFARSS